MSIQAHIDTLELKHQRLKDEIRDAYLHHVSESSLMELKKQKLLLKDEIEVLKQHFSEQSERREAA